MSDAGDTVTLVGQGKTTSDVITTSVSAIADCGSTPQYTYHYENTSVSFTSSNSILKGLSLKVFMPSNLVVPSLTGINFSVGNVLMADNSMEYVNIHIPFPEDSILLNGKYEAGIFIDNYSNKTVLFNFSKGVLKFTDSNNKTWRKIQ